MKRSAAACEQNTDAKKPRGAKLQDTSPIANGLHLTIVRGLDDDKSTRPDCDLAETISSLSFPALISRINPSRSIHFNYSVDADFVLGAYPNRCRQTPIALVVGADQQLGALRTHCAQRYSNVTVVGASLPFPYGTHHTKLSMFESGGEGSGGRAAAMHVVVSTANLVESDWDQKTQMFYYRRALLRGEEWSGEGSQAPSSFEADLIDYLERAYPAKSGAVHKEVGHWLARLRSGQADFNGCNDRLVFSYPARLPRPDAHLGHIRLRELLQTKFNSEELSKLRTFISQFSSIGSLGTRPEAWLCGEFLASLAGGRAGTSHTALKLIFPTVDNVRLSLEGYAAGGSLPHSDATAKKQPYLRQFIHQWRSDRLGRTRAMPHVKTYTALNDDGEPEWLLVTSANLSNSAWGKLEKEGTQLFCRAYELGVLICAKDHEGGLAKLLPYDLPLTKYTASDEAFVWDKVYKERDAWGRRGVMG